MSGQIIIENLTERHIQYHLDHQGLCVKVGKCFCKKGRRGNVASSVHVPGGIGLRSAPLHSAVALMPQVKKDADGPRPRITIHTYVKPDNGAKEIEALKTKRAAARKKAKAAAEKAAGAGAKADSETAKNTGGGRRGKNG